MAVCDGTLENGRRWHMCMCMLKMWKHVINKSRLLVRRVIEYSYLINYTNFNISWIWYNCRVSKNKETKHQTNPTEGTAAGEKGSTRENGCSPRRRIDIETDDPPRKTVVLPGVIASVTTLAASRNDLSHQHLFNFRDTTAISDPAPNLIMTKMNIDYNS